MNPPTHTRSVKPRRAFYSLVQYCPDSSRLEVANIGVVVYCAELNFLGTRMSQNHTRINQMFGRGERDLKRLRTLKASLQEKLETGCSTLMSLEHLNQLAALHVNTIRMSEFMPCRVSEAPYNDLKELFDKLVQPPAQRKNVSKVEALRQALDSRFSNPEIDKRLRRKLKVQIPVLDREEEIPYGYQNGRFNLITPVVFPKGKSALEERSARYAVEGKSIYDHRNEQFGEMQLLIVGDFDSGTPDSVDTARRILESHRVRLFRRSELQTLEQEIIQLGHVVTVE